MMVELIKEKASSQLQAIGGQKKERHITFKAIVNNIEDEDDANFNDVHLLIEQQPWGSSGNKTYYVYSLGG